MPTLYQELYYYLFNQITDAITAIERQDYGTAKNILICAQQTAEERYLDAEE